MKQKYLPAVGIMVLVIATIFMRLPFLHQAGFDDVSFRAWGTKLAQVGLSNVYLGAAPPNYPPLYFYLLTPVAWLSVHIFHADPSTSLTFITLQKSANVLVDCLDGLVLFLIAKKPVFSYHTSWN